MAEQRETVRLADVQAVRRALQQQHFLAGGRAEERAERLRVRARADRRAEVVRALLEGRADGWGA